MKNRKIIYVGFLLVFLVLGILSVVSFVSARHAWWHPWGEEVQEAPFEATVGLANSPPTIVALLEVTDLDVTGIPVTSSPVRDVQPFAAVSGALGNVYANVSFIVEDPNGASDLPTVPGGANPPVIVTFGSPTVANYEIAVRTVSPVSGIRCIGPGCRNRDAAIGVFPAGSAPAACYATSCNGAAGPAVSGCNNGAGVSPYGGTVSLNQMKFNCLVRMEFYDQPSLTAKAAQNDFWTFSLYIEDSTGNSNTRTSTNFVTLPWDAADEAFVMDYLTVKGMDVDLGPPAERLAWTGVSVTATDTPGGDNDPGDADTGLTFRNRGNLAIPSLNLRPQDLTGDIISTAILQVESMSVDDIAGGVNIGACDSINGGGTAPFDATDLAGNTLITGVAGLIVGFNADNAYISGTNQDELFACIWQRLDSLTGCAGGACLTGGSDTAYSANDACGAACDAAGEQWEIIAV